VGEMGIEIWKIKGFNRIIEYKQLSKLFLTENKLHILNALLQSDKINKTQLHNVLKNNEVKISYKNLLSNLDSFYKIGLIKFVQSKKNNAQMIELNKIQLYKYYTDYVDFLSLIFDK
jgi:Fe2+ or Zn2+ uptake regulation protein